MIDKMIFIKGEPRKISEEKLKISHYTTVKESEAEDLKQYIEQNINEYIGNVFLQIETNTQEDEKYIVDLLNNEDLEIENKQSIIEKEEAKISDISEVKDKELWEFIFEKNKITASWKNILNYYQYKEQNLDEIIIDFISSEENYKQLAIKENEVKEYMIEQEKAEEKLEVVIEFMENIGSKIEKIENDMKILKKELEKNINVKMRGE